MNTILIIAEQAKAYKGELDSGEISPEEFKELIDDLDIVNQIQTDAAKMDLDEKTHEVLMDIIKIASMIK